MLEPVPDEAAAKVGRWWSDGVMRGALLIAGITLLLALLPLLSGPDPRGNWGNNFVAASLIEVALGAVEFVTGVVGTMLYPHPRKAGPTLLAASLIAMALAAALFFLGLGTCRIG